MTRSEATARFRRETAEAIESYRRVLAALVHVYKRDFSNPLMRLAFESAWDELTLDLAEISHRLDDARVLGARHTNAEYTPTTSRSRT